MPISAAAAIADISWGAARGLMVEGAGIETRFRRQSPDGLCYIGVDEKSWWRGEEPDRFYGSGSLWFVLLLVGCSVG